MQNERLRTEFSDALNNFQTVQRTAAEKERASVSRARAHSGYGVAVSILVFYFIFITKKTSLFLQTTSIFIRRDLQVRNVPKCKVCIYKIYRVGLVKFK